MDKSDMMLQKYGLVPTLEYRDEIRELLEQEIINDLAEDNEYLKTLCILLFGLGNVEDTL